MLETTKNEMKKAMREVLEENGLLTPNMSREEVIHLTSRYRYDKAVRLGYLHRIKGEGKNASVEVRRTEFIELTEKGMI